jgi:general secretion pathway protein D
VQILTVTFDNSRTTGIDWSQLYSLQNFDVKKLITSRRNLGSGLEWDENRITTQNPDPTASPLTTGAIVADGSTKVNEIVKFLKTQGDVKSVSSPRVMTLSNQPALISVGKELFYKLKASTKKDGDSTEGETIDSVFAGILLDITPEIDDRGMITLKVNPSITETLTPITGDGTRTMPPDLVRRQIASVIKVKDGNHAILGGLISTTTGTKVNKVPLLGDIPLLEYAFKREEKIEKTEELVIIITPHIVRDNRNLSLKDLGYRRLR